MNATSSNIGWGFWGRWLAATALAWLVGLLSAIVLSYMVVNLVYPKETNLIVGLCVGAVVGLGQLFAVRRWITLSQHWIWGAMVAVGPYFVAAVLIDEFWSGLGTLPEQVLLGSIAVVGGTIGGLLQARALRIHTPRANWWVLASLISWGVAWPAGMIAGGIVLGAVGGGLLVWLLRTPDAPSSDPVASAPIVA